MFSEASVSHSVHGGGRGWADPPGGIHPLKADRLVVTSIGGHWSCRYTSYWNAFLFYLIYLDRNYYRPQTKFAKVMFLVAP